MALTLHSTSSNGLTFIECVFSFKKKEGGLIIAVWHTRVFGELISTWDRFVQTAPADAQIALWEFILREVNFYFPSDICQQRLGVANIASIFLTLQFLATELITLSYICYSCQLRLQMGPNNAICSDAFELQLPEFVGGTTRWWLCWLGILGTAVSTQLRTHHVWSSGTQDCGIQHRKQDN